MRVSITKLITPSITTAGQWLKIVEYGVIYRSDGFTEDGTDEDCTNLDLSCLSDQC